MSKLIPLKQIIPVEDPERLVLSGGDDPVTLRVESGDVEFSGSVWVQDIGYLTDFSSSISSSFLQVDTDITEFSSSVYGDFIITNNTIESVSSSLDESKLNISDYEVDSGSFDVRIEEAGIFKQTGSFYATTNDLEITGSIKNSGSIETLGALVDTQEDTEFLALGNRVEFEFDDLNFEGSFEVSGSSTFDGTVDVLGIGDLTNFSSSISSSFLQVDTDISDFSSSVHDDFQDVDTTITNLSSSVSDDLDNKENILSLDSKTTSFTLSQTDGTFIECNNGTDIIVTIPDNTTEPFRIGYIVTFWQNDVGGIEVVGDTGVTLNGNPNTDGQYSGIQAIKADTNRWNLLGGVE